jgi:protein ImuB
MNYAAILVPGFPLHALLRVEAGLADRPVAVVTGEGRHAVVLASNRPSLLPPGLAVTLALARCHELVLRAPHPVAEVEADRVLQAAALTLSPRVEATARCHCTVDLQGADPTVTVTTLRRRLPELSAQGLPARAGLAPTPDLAAYAAARAEPLLVVEDARAFLADLPITLAEPSPDQSRILAGWGVHTFTQLTALPKAETATRLGAGGLGLWERAAGVSTRPLRLLTPARSFAAAWDYDPPIETLEPLSFKLRRYAERLAWELRAAHLVAESLHLTLRLDDDRTLRREFGLPEPDAEVDRWMRVMMVHLETLRVEVPLVGASLVVKPTRPRVRQGGLFETGLKDPGSFWETVARLSAIVGEDRVGTPVVLNTHRPDAFALEKPSEVVPPPALAPLHPARGLVLRRYRPARPVRVQIQGGRPVAVQGDPHGAVEASAGPWRLAGEWWEAGGAWNLELWQVQLGGVAYQVARDAEGWRVEGVWD